MRSFHLIQVKSTLYEIRHRLKMNYKIKNGFLSEFPSYIFFFFCIFCIGTNKTIPIYNKIYKIFAKLLTKIFAYILYTKIMMCEYE